LEWQIKIPPCLEGLEITLKKAYACGWGLSRDNALMSGVRQKERFS